MDKAQQASQLRLAATLATPPDGRPLHNPDNLTAEQVGVGYRLIVEGEKVPKSGAQWWNCGSWSSSTGDYVPRSNTVRLPLSVPWPEVKPDPYAELKAAHAAGKVIQLRNAKRGRTEWKDDDEAEATAPTFERAGKRWTRHTPGDPMPCAETEVVEVLLADGYINCEGWAASRVRWTKGNSSDIIGWRYADEKKPVPLKWTDVPPLSIFRLINRSMNSDVWSSVTAMGKNGLVISYTFVSFDELQQLYEINRPRYRDQDGNPTLWEPCSKSA